MADNKEKLGDKTCLRPIQEEELELIMNWRMRPEITRFMYTDPILTIEQQKEWFSRIREDNTCIYFMIEYDKEPIGVLDIAQIDRANRKCFWAYYIAERRSYDSLDFAITLEWNVYDYVFDVLDLHKLEAEVFSFNKGVIGLHKLSGSVVEGTRRAHILKNGEYFDVVEMGIVKEEWEEIRKKHDYEKFKFITDGNYVFKGGGSGRY